MGDERLGIIAFALAILAVIGGALFIKSGDQPPEPVTTVQFDCLIVDSDGVSVRAMLTVENEDVLTLITGEKWRFQRRMEEQ